ncbi:MAG: hypothetical protein AAGE76_01395 [Pseudomonadota bacterium]
MKRRWYWAAGLVALAAFVWWSQPTQIAAPSARLAALEPRLTNPQDRGAAVFAFGDFGALSADTLRSSAAPWKLLVAALALREVEGDVAALGGVNIVALFRRYGFHSPETIVNWPAHLPPPDLSAPVGLNAGYAAHDIWPVAVTIANTGCAACHASVVYGADGRPDPTRIWLGTPNGSINLEAYAQDVFAAFRAFAGDTDRLMQAVMALFPDTTWQERATLRWAIAGTIAREVAARDAQLGRLLPFSGGLPGATNGLDALRHRLGLIPPGRIVSESVYNSVPELGGRVWRTGLLNTNTYAVPGRARLSPMAAAQIDDDHLAGLAGIIAYFTVPSMGVSDAVAAAHIADAAQVAAWMRDYRPQPFPGEIDESLLPKGRSVYAAGCSGCHGRYDDSLTAPALVSFPNWLGDVGTDRRRIELTDETIARAVAAGPYAAHISAAAAEGYIAPPLTGIWSSAPYLHNGSVPTLWHLMHPETRPERFVVGGHALDLDRVGIAGVDDGSGGWMPPEGHTPWAIPVEVDTSRYGMSRTGHEDAFEGLDAADRAALLEYLKRL